MRKWAAVLLAGFLLVGLFTGCNTSKAYEDGNYRAEVQNYDSRGYKDYIEVTVENGAVTAMTYDAVSEDGIQKSQDEKYEKDMQAVQETYPARYSKDLVNQFLETQSIGGVDVIAGATYSSESFIALFKALEPNMQAGDTTTVVIENMPEK